MARARAVKTHHALHHSRGAFTNKCARARAGIDRYVAELRVRFGASGRYGFERRQLSMPGQTDGRTDGHPTVTYRPCTACSVYNKQRSLPIFCDGVAIRYVLPVLQMTSRAHNGLYGGMSIPFQRMTLLRRRAQASAAATSY